MTYNILGGAKGIERLAATIRAQSPDIVCLQEATVRDGGEDSTTALSRLLPDYQYARASDVTTFSRFPIKEQRAYDLGREVHRKVLETVVEIGGRRVAIVNVHLVAVQLRGGLPLWRIPYQVNIDDSNQFRRQQFQIVRRAAQNSGLPFIIAGDFNTPPRGRLYNQMKRDFNDAFSLRGLGFGQTFPARLPLLRIDYLWSRKDWLPVSARTISSQASDHRALVADYLL